ncbi:MAG: L,D-transpeptidase [Roseibacillus sp.]|nr:L,D-transpeptidase [Roseibacillus sp.]
MKNLLLLSAAGACLAFVSCSTSSGVRGGSARYAAYDRPASKPSNPSRVTVKVSIRNQAAYVMEGNRALLVMPVAVGTSSNPTPQGSFRIFIKDHKHRANSHGYAYNGNSVVQTWLSKKPAGWKFKGTPMPYWCEFKANYGFHTGWMKPYPCTYGCLRMHENLAPKFYNLVRIGTPVSIRTTQPEDATIGRNIPRPPDASPLSDYPYSFYLGNGYFTKHKTPSYR